MKAPPAASHPVGDALASSGSLLFRAPLLLRDSVLDCDALGLLIEMTVETRAKTDRATSPTRPYRGVEGWVGRSLKSSCSVGRGEGVIWITTDIEYNRQQSGASRSGSGRDIPGDLMLKCFVCPIVSVWVNVHLGSVGYPPGKAISCSVGTNLPARRR